MSRRRARLECLDDDHATTATWAGMDRLVCRLGASSRLILRRRPRWLWGRRLGDQLASPGDGVGLGTAAGEQAVVPDAVEPLGQDVQHETPDELGRCQRHGFVAVRPLDPAGNCCLEKSRQIAESSTEPVSVTKAAYINRMKFNYLRRRLKDMSCRG